MEGTISWGELGKVDRYGIKGSSSASIVNFRQDTLVIEMEVIQVSVVVERERNLTLNYYYVL